MNPDQVIPGKSVFCFLMGNATGNYWMVEFPLIISFRVRESRRIMMDSSQVKGAEEKLLLKLNGADKAKIYDACEVMFLPDFR